MKSSCKQTDWDRDSAARQTPLGRKVDSRVSRCQSSFEETAKKRGEIETSITCAYDEKYLLNHKLGLKIKKKERREREEKVQGENRAI